MLRISGRYHHQDTTPSYVFEIPWWIKHARKSLWLFIPILQLYSRFTLRNVLRVSSCFFHFAEAVGTSNLDIRVQEPTLEFASIFSANDDNHQEALRVERQAEERWEGGQLSPMRCFFGRKEHEQICLCLQNTFMFVNICWSSNKFSCQRSKNLSQ